MAPDVIGREHPLPHPPKHFQSRSHDLCLLVCKCPSGRTRLRWFLLRLPFRKAFIAIQLPRTRRPDEHIPWHLRLHHRATTRLAVPLITADPPQHRRWRWLRLPRMKLPPYPLNHIFGQRHRRIHRAVLTRRRRRQLPINRQPFLPCQLPHCCLIRAHSCQSVVKTKSYASPSTDPADDPSYSAWGASPWPNGQSTPYDQAKKKYLRMATGRNTQSTANQNTKRKK